MLVLYSQLVILDLSFYLDSSITNQESPITNADCYTSSASVSLRRSKTKYPTRNTSTEAAPTTTSRGQLVNGPGRNNTSWYATARCVNGFRFSNRRTVGGACERG